MLCFFCGYQSFKLNIIAAIIPGTHPNKVKNVTIKTDPHPLSITASGGSRMHIMALIIPISKQLDNFYSGSKDLLSMVLLIHC